jgi:hypothetical protein
VLKKNRSGSSTMRSCSIARPGFMEETPASKGDFKTQQFAFLPPVHAIRNYRSDSITMPQFKCNSAKFMRQWNSRVHRSGARGFQNGLRPLKFFSILLVSSLSYTTIVTRQTPPNHIWCRVNCNITVRFFDCTEFGISAF